MSNSKDISAATPRRTATPRTANPSGKPDAALEHIRKLTATLRGNLEKCATDPDVDPVHDVRTGTRRLQAMIEAIPRERGDESLQQPVGEWLGALKRMRRAAAPVRDLDVHRKLLSKLSGSGSQSNEGAEQSPEPGNPVAQQAASLDAWLHHARQHHAEELKKKAAKLLAKFDAQAGAVDSAIQQGRRARRRLGSAAVVALESFARLVHEMEQLDASNLHDFRKGAKKARYIAESAAEDAHALAIGKALKKLQDDIGDWHDWLVLADEARAALGDEGKELIALVDAERDRHYALAMKTVSRLRGRLMGEWLAISQTRRHSRVLSANRKELSS